MTPTRSLKKITAGALGARALLSQIRKEPNELKKKMMLVGYITSRLERKSQSIYLVGGQAVETYTAGQFTTGDVDITTTDRRTTEQILARLGFKGEGMIWLNEGMGIAVHIVDVIPKSTEGIRTIHVGPYAVRVVGVEELIVDRLAAAKFWKSQRDAEQATALINTFARRIDMKYLRRRAREEKVDDVLPK
jgi:hypothetical protein